MATIEQLHTLLKDEVKARKIYGTHRFSGNRLSVERRHSDKCIKITVGAMFLVEDELTGEAEWTHTIEETFAWAMERVS